MVGAPVHCQAGSSEASAVSNSRRKVLGIRRPPPVSRSKQRRQTHIPSASAATTSSSSVSKRQILHVHMIDSSSVLPVLVSACLRSGCDIELALSPSGPPVLPPSPCRARPVGNDRSTV